MSFAPNPPLDPKITRIYVPANNGLAQDRRFDVHARELALPIVAAMMSRVLGAARELTGVPLTSPE
jgi:hypothetical protein